MVADDSWRRQLEALGEYIRSQRMLAHLSLRQMAELTSVSNPYLSQVERGVHEPSIRVLHAIARALGLSTEALLGGAGLLDDVEDVDAGLLDTESAIRADRRLTDEQKEALLVVYRSYVSD